MRASGEANRFEVFRTMEARQHAPKLLWAASLQRHVCSTAAQPSSKLGLGARCRAASSVGHHHPPANLLVHGAPAAQMGGGG
jgi:hypothetical protein